MWPVSDCEFPKTPLDIALGNQHFGAAQALIEFGADVDALRSRAAPDEPALKLTSLHFASAYQSLDVVEL